MVQRQLCSLGRSEASALAEFAVSLPLLVVLVVGIFDFGGAFNTKQELNNAVREAARYGAAEPTYDLTNTPPASIDAIRVLVDSYLQASRINDCGLSSVAVSAGPGVLEWQYKTNSQNGCIGAFSLTIIRGFDANPVNSCGLVASNYGQPNPITANIPCTHVTISYPYQWMFNSVIQLIVPGANYGPLIQIQTDATAVNMD